jgi:hypothetical protein
MFYKEEKKMNSGFVDPKVKKMNSGFVDPKVMKFRQDAAIAELKKTQKFNPIVFHEHGNNEEFQIRYIKLLPIRELDTALEFCYHSNNLVAVILYRLGFPLQYLREQSWYERIFGGQKGKVIEDLMKTRSFNPHIFHKYDNDEEFQIEYINTLSYREFDYYLLEQCVHNQLLFEYVGNKIEIIFQQVRDRMRLRDRMRHQFAEPGVVTKEQMEVQEV